MGHIVYLLCFVTHVLIDVVTDLALQVNIKAIVLAPRILLLFVFIPFYVF